MKEKHVFLQRGRMHMKELIFNKKDYKSYQDMYRDMAEKTGVNKTEDYFDTSDFSLSGDILWECLQCDFGYKKIPIKIVLVNFDREKIRSQKNFDDYKYNIIIEVFEDFVKEFPNNKLEFKME